MAEEIVNKVAKSPLITIDLEDFLPKGEHDLLDISDWLFEGIMLKERDFRESVKQHNWEQYQDKLVAVFCSADAIVPQWAFMLIAAELAPFALKMAYGNLDMLKTMLFQESISKINVDEYRDKPVIIKGCGDIEIPNHAYLLIAQKLQPVVKSLMFGEACSTVPIYKKKK